MLIPAVPNQLAKHVILVNYPNFINIFSKKMELIKSKNLFPKKMTSSLYQTMLSTKKITFVKTF